MTRWIPTRSAWTAESGWSRVPPVASAERPRSPSPASVWMSPCVTAYEAGLGTLRAELEAIGAGVVAETLDVRDLDGGGRVRGIGG